jgi:P4 family phage/plasmid primase-like protien
MSNIEQIGEFLKRLHGAESAGHLVVWTRPDKITRSFNLSKDGAVEEASAYCARRAEKSDVYAAVGLQRESPPARSRGTEDGVCSIPGIWADVDIAGPAHKSKDLPASEAEAWTIINEVELPTSVVLRSGFGLQVYWLFKEPWVLESAADRAAAKSLSVRFQTRLRQIAKTRGWMIDPTADLCRVLRVPGTYNRKIPDDPRLVTAEYSKSEYNVDDIEGILEGIEDPGPVVHREYAEGEMPLAQIEPIVEGCPWMRHCRDDARTLPEPEWYRMLTVVARCENADHWAHELSRAYPNYKPRETTGKLRQATSNKIAPVTCAYVEADLAGERYCSECLFRGHMNSPITIGRIGAEKETDESEPSSDQMATPALSSVPTPELSSEGSEESASDPVDGEIVSLASTIERFTDLGNAKRFVARYRDRVRFCDKWAKWFLWDGLRWKEDEKREVVSMAGDMIRGLYSMARKIRKAEEREAFLKHIHRSESYRSMTAMMSLAKADKALAAHPDEFDRNPWLLTVNNGTIDLRTGKLGPHAPQDMITRLAPVTYDPEAKCPNWLEFLYMVMNYRSSLVSFLQRAFGVSLTGVTSEKALYILYGAGGDNGKSTMVDVMQSLLGNYGLRTPVETLLRKKEGAIPNDVARLRGARFVWSSESDRGARLSESLIKDVTGGDKLSARFMRGEFFEFEPEFKLWLATNHKPTVRGDPAIWRRLKLTPFDISIPVEKQRPRHEVMAMFRAEFAGILNWAIQGCLEWQRDGLGVPDEVVFATKEYEAEQDTFAMFLEEKCVCVKNAQAASSDLYRSFREWAEAHGERVVSHKIFASWLSERGFKRKKTRTVMIYLGVGLRAAERSDGPGSASKQASGNGSEPVQGRLDDEGEEI